MNGGSFPSLSRSIILLHVQDQIRTFSSVSFDVSWYFFSSFLENFGRNRMNRNRLDQRSSPYATSVFFLLFRFHFLCIALRKELQKMPLAKDLLHPSLEEERRKHKKKRLVQSPNSYFMDVKCPGCYKITTGAMILQLFFFFVFQWTESLDCSLFSRFFSF